MDFLVEGEKVITQFEGGLSCKRRLFFGQIILTNYRLITVSSSIQRNTGNKSELSKHPFHKFSTAGLKKDTFLAKLDKQKLAESILHLDKAYQFPTTKVLKKKGKKNQFVFKVTLEYEDNGVIKKEDIKIIIQPKRIKGAAYRYYVTMCERIFFDLNRTLKQG